MKQVVVLPSQTEGEDICQRWNLRKENLTFWANLPFGVLDHQVNKGVCLAFMYLDPMKFHN